MSWHLPVTFLLGALAVPAATQAAEPVTIASWTASSCTPDASLPDRAPVTVEAVTVGDAPTRHVTLVAATEPSGACAGETLAITSHEPVVVTLACDRPGARLSVARRPSPWSARATPVVALDHGARFAVPEARGGLLRTAAVHLAPPADGGPVRCALSLATAHGPLPPVQAVPARDPLLGLASTDAPPLAAR